jgi:hypothetical protein
MVAFDRTDLNFSLTQIRTPANGRPPCNPNLACGVREVSATHNAGLGSGYQPLHNFTTPSGGDDRLLSDNVTLDCRPVLAQFDASGALDTPITIQDAPSSRSTAFAAWAAITSCRTIFSSGR